MITYGTWLQLAAGRLRAAGIGTARLDALVLLEDATGSGRASLLAHPEAGLTAAQRQQLEAALRRREQHEPLAYIRGHAEFYGRRFAVDHSVLVPRPETEMMIEMLLQAATRDAAGAISTGTGAVAGVHETAIVDIGTGSGALAVTAALELPGRPVTALDIDPACLRMAGRNAAALGADVRLLCGDLLQPLIDTDPDSLAGAVLLCNLPYVPDDYPINRPARHEPRLALFGTADDSAANPDGLEPYRRLFGQLTTAGAQPEAVLTEALPEQHDALWQIAQAAGYRLRRSEDFIQLFVPQPA